MVSTFLMFVQRLQCLLQAKSEPSKVSPEGAKGLPSFFIIAQRLSAELPEEAWENWPSDYSKNLDYYLYEISEVRG